MVGYRCYILDAKDHILQAHNIDCDNDMQARAEAENFLNHDPYYQSVEIWRSTRRIGRLERRDADVRLRAFRSPARSFRPVASLP